MQQPASLGVPFVPLLLLLLSGACSRTSVPGVATVAVAPSAELYGAGLFSTSAWDFFLAWTPDESRVLFCRADTMFSIAPAAARS